ncbi:MAG: histidinol-phosphatase [Chloroflexi bacterium]|nr:histidinol-phosphatase [Chloroflexota bacterium]
MGVRDLADDLRVALEIADRADAISSRYFRSEGLTVENKPDLTPVTQADREIERMVRDRLAESRPEDSVLGEEFGHSGGTSGARWIVDPIDGTKRFMRGLPVFATLLALEVDGRIVVGVASAPAIRQRWWAARGLGAFNNDGQLHVSHVSQLQDAHLAHASLDGWLETRQMQRLENIAENAWSTTGIGDFWCHVLVAEGALDAALEPTAMLWDLAPLKIIVEEAGGKLTDFQNVDSANGPSALTSNGTALHQELYALLQAMPSTR